MDLPFAIAKQPNRCWVRIVATDVRPRIPQPAGDDQRISWELKGLGRSNIKRMGLVFDLISKRICLREDIGIEHGLMIVRKKPARSVTHRLKVGAIRRGKRYAVARFKRLDFSVAASGNIARACNVRRGHSRNERLQGAICHSDTKPFEKDFAARS